MSLRNLFCFAKIQNSLYISHFLPTICNRFDERSKNPLQFQFFNVYDFDKRLKINSCANFQNSQSYLSKIGSKSIETRKLHKK